MPKPAHLLLYEEPYSYTVPPLRHVASPPPRRPLSKPIKYTLSRALGRVQAHMLIRIERIERGHLLVRELKVEYLGVRDDAFGRVGFRQGDESSAESVMQIS